MMEPNASPEESPDTIAANIAILANLLIEEVRKLSPDDRAAYDAYCAVEEGLMRVGVPSRIPDDIDGARNGDNGGSNDGDFEETVQSGGTRVNRDAGTSDDGGLHTTETGHDDDEGGDKNITLQAINTMLATTDQVIRQLERAIQANREHREAWDVRNVLQLENLQVNDEDDEGSA